MASNVLVFNSKMYVDCQMSELNISGQFAKLVNEKSYNKITNPLLSLLTKILILDTDNEEYKILNKECNILENMRPLMDSFLENVEVLENFVDIIEVLFKKAHAGNFDEENRIKVIEFGYSFFN